MSSPCGSLALGHPCNKPAQRNHVSGEWRQQTRATNPRNDTTLGLNAEGAIIAQALIEGTRVTHPRKDTTLGLNAKGAINAQTLIEGTRVTYPRNGTTSVCKTFAICFT